MKFRIAMLLLALAAILVAAGCNDSNYSADAADNSKAVETVNASTDTGVAPPAANPCGAEATEGKSCEGGCCPGEKGTEAASKEACAECAAAEGGTCEHCAAEAKEGIVTTDASMGGEGEKDCCGKEGCEGKEDKDCGDCDGKDCGDCDGKDCEGKEKSADKDDTASTETGTKG
ncbi:hypothetical protein KDL29_03265 [bacterium]|nr:hypothetical protein [bacterium]